MASIEAVIIVILLVVIAIMVSFLVRLSNMVDSEREEKENLIRNVKMATYGFETVEDFEKCDPLTWYGTLIDIERLKKMESHFEDMEDRYKQLGKDKYALNERYILLISRVQSLPLPTLKKYKLQYVLEKKGRQSLKTK